MGYNPQEFLENTINTMGTLLGVHPIVPWFIQISIIPKPEWSADFGGMPLQSPPFKVTSAVWSL